MHARPAGPKCERDDCMIRTTPSYRAGRHYGAFLLIQASVLLPRNDTVLAVGGGFLHIA